MCLPGFFAFNLEAIPVRHSRALSCRPLHRRDTTATRVQRTRIFFPLRGSPIFQATQAFMDTTRGCKIFFCYQSRVLHFRLDTAGFKRRLPSSPGGLALIHRWQEKVHIKAAMTRLNCQAPVAFENNFSSR